MTNIIHILFEYIGQVIYHPNFYMRISRKGTGGTDPYPHSRKIKPSSAHLVCTGYRFSSEFFIQSFLVDGSKRYQNVGSPPDTYILFLIQACLKIKTEENQVYLVILRKNILRLFKFQEALITIYAPK